MNAVPSCVENITVNPDQKIITWAAPAEPNGIIVGYRVQYWELGRREAAEEVNTIVEVFSYINFSKYSTAQTILKCKSQLKRHRDTVNAHFLQLKLFLTRCKFKLPL